MVAIIKRLCFGFSARKNSSMGLAAIDRYTSSRCFGQCFAILLIKIVIRG